MKIKNQALTSCKLQGGVWWFANCGFSFRSSVSFGQKRSPKSAPTTWCAEKQNIGLIIVLHAVNKMEESGSSGMNLRCRLAGGGIKPPKGALVKSHGTERLGNGSAVSRLRYGYKS